VRVAVTATRGRFEWDAAKAAANLKNHKIAFELSTALDLENAVTQEQIVGGERRVLSYAVAAGRLYAMVWTLRGGRMRIISLRKANERGVARYGPS